jgi:hypothetical protein
MKLRLARARQAKLPDGARWDEGAPGRGLPVFGCLARGVSLDWLGGEGSVVAHGHIHVMRFAAACESLARRDGRAEPTADWMAFADEVRYGWAVHAFASTPEDWRIHWDGVTADTPGAFPVTIFGPGW